MTTTTAMMRFSIMGYDVDSVAPFWEMVREFLFFFFFWMRIRENKSSIFPSPFIRKREKRNPIRQHQGTEKRQDPQFSFFFFFVLMFFCGDVGGVLSVNRLEHQGGHPGIFVQEKRERKYSGNWGEIGTREIPIGGILPQGQIPILNNFFVLRPRVEGSDSLRSDCCVRISTLIPRPFAS